MSETLPKRKFFRDVSRGSSLRDKGVLVFVTATEKELLRRAALVDRRSMRAILAAGGVDLARRVLKVTDEAEAQPTRGDCSVCQGAGRVIQDHDGRVGYATCGKCKGTGVG